MASPTLNATVLRRAFVDICRGYSIGKYLGKDLYVRHLSHHHHVEYDLRQLQFEEYAVEHGAPREADQMEKLRKKGLWTDAKDREIERQRDTIIRFEEARKSVVLPSVQEHYDKQIRDERDKLEKVLVERATLLGMTAEVYGQRRLNDHYILTNVFADAQFTQPLHDEDSFDDLEDSAVEALLTAYHTAIIPCDDGNLRKLAVQEYFTSYYNLCGDRLDAFFGKAVCQLTYYQVRLGNIAKYFKALTEQMDISKVDPKDRHNPDAIEKLFMSQKNMAKLSEDGKVPTNMSSDDVKQLGLKGQLTEVKEEMDASELVKRLMKRSH